MFLGMTLRPSGVWVPPHSVHQAALDRWKHHWAVLTDLVLPQNTLPLAQVVISSYCMLEVQEGVEESRQLGLHL